MTSPLRLLSRGLLVLLALAATASQLACGPAGPFRKQLVFERDQLQQKVAAKFPLKKKKKLTLVTLSNPQVLLAAGSERLGIGMDVKVSTLGKKLKGHVEVDGDIRYNPDKGEFSVVDSRIRKLDIAGVAARKLGPIETVVKALAKRYMSDIPVYKLDQGDFKQNVAKLLLKSVTVEDGRIVVVVGL